MPDRSVAAVPDFQNFFQSGPALSIVVSPGPNYEIVAVTDSYLRATMTNRQEILGRGLFDVFPHNSADSGGTEVRNSLRRSFEEVVRTGKPEVMPVQRYDIRRLSGEAVFEERYWRALISPVFAPEEEVVCIICQVEDATEFVRLKQRDGDEQGASSMLQSRAEHSEAEAALRGQEILCLNSQLRAADEARLDMQTSQLVKQTQQLREANNNLRDLSARLLQIQDEERRRIARELHDSIGQMLVAQGIYLSSVAAESKHLSATAAQALKDSTALIDEMSKELRTIAYLLHPPLLDEAGLISAIHCYAEGFAERSRIKVQLELASDLGRLTDAFEIAIFRIVQECLTNIHRHSGSPSATIRLARSTEGVILEVRDEGHGIPVDKRAKAISGSLPGVGIRGMQERIAQLGGVVEISSNGSGTAIVARLPIANTCLFPAIDGQV